MKYKGVVHVVDDEEGMRQSLAMLLEAAGYHVRLYPSAKPFLAHGPSSTGCIVSDVRMPGMDGLDLLGHLREARSRLPVVLITGHADVRMAVAALRAGAADFLEKPFEVDDLLTAIENALAPRIGKIDESVTMQARSRLRELTPRERDVLRQLVAGGSNKHVARALDLSPRTIEFHRAHIMAKTRAKTLAELVRVSLEAADPADRNGTVAGNDFAVMGGPGTSSGFPATR